MSLSSPSVPTVENPSSVAQTQQGYNLQGAVDTAALNRVPQSTAFGNINYNVIGTGPNGVPLYSSSVGLNPQLQGIVNSLMGQTGNLMTGANYGGTDPATAVGDATKGGTQAMMQNFTDYMNPYFTTQTSQLDTQLKNQGLQPGSPAYDNAMRGLQNNQGNTVTGALTQFEPLAYNQSMSNYLLPLSVSAQQMGLLGQVPGMVNGSFINPPQANVNPADYTGAVSSYNTANMNAYNAQTQAQSAMMSGLFGIPSAMLGGWARGGFAGNPLTAMFGAV